MLLSLSEESKAAYFTGMEEARNLWRFYDRELHVKDREEDGRKMLSVIQIKYNKTGNLQTSFQLKTKVNVRGISLLK
jgi:hypothetical protein